MYKLKAAEWRPEHFKWQVADRVATVTLNRPDRKNPLTFESYAELRDTFHRLQYAEDVRAVVITGAGFDPRATISVSTPAGGGPITPQATIAANQISFSVNMPGQGAPYISVVRINNPDGGFTTASFQVT